MAARMRRIQEEVRKAMGDGFDLIGEAIEEHDKRGKCLEAKRDIGPIGPPHGETREGHGGAHGAHGGHAQGPLQVSTADWVEEGVPHEHLVKVCADANVAKSARRFDCAAKPGLRRDERGGSTARRNP